MPGADVITRFLEEGYDTLHSHQFKSVMELSIGEWRKIALARAFRSPWNGPLGRGAGLSEISGRCPRS
jgi:hypothetical protein